MKLHRFPQINHDSFEASCLMLPWTWDKDNETLISISEFMGVVIDMCCKYHTSVLCQVKPKHIGVEWFLDYQFSFLFLNVFPRLLKQVPWHHLFIILCFWFIPMPSCRLVLMKFKSFESLKNTDSVNTYNITRALVNLIYQVVG